MLEVERGKAPEQRTTLARSILLIDDEEAVLRFLEAYFLRQGWEVFKTSSPQEALRLYASERPSVVLLDVHMPILDGIQLLEVLREQDPDPAIVMLTGKAEFGTAIAAMKLGAENYLQKPLDLEQLTVVVENALEKTRLRRGNRALSLRAPDGKLVSELIQNDPLLRELQSEIDRLADSEISVLIMGDTGTGKSRLARSIHARSPRAREPFIEVSCARLSSDNLESELFGTERVTTRGRRVDARGLVEQADGGTLFLDEVGALSLEVQPQLLGVLETRRFRRAGGIDEVKANVRIITATNRNLEEEIQAGRFRSDLYFRLAAAPLRLPAVRELGTSAVVESVRMVLQSVAQESGRGSVSIDPAAERLLGSYAWPGNFREMKSVLDRLLILNPGVQLIAPEHVPAEIRGGGPSAVTGLDPTNTIEEAERALVTLALRHFGGNRSKTARSLGISRRALYDKMERYAAKEEEASIR